MSRRREQSEPPPHAPLPGEQSARDLLFEKGLPCDLFAERCLLGSLLINPEHWGAVDGLKPEAFSREDYRRIYSAMLSVRESDEEVNTVTLHGALVAKGQIESVGNLAGLVELTEDLPEFKDLSSYVRRIRDKQSLRDVIYLAQATIDKALTANTTAEEVASGLEEKVRIINYARSRNDDGRTPEQVVADFPGGIGTFLDPSSRPRGIQTGFDRFDDLTTGFHPGDLWVLGGRTGHGKSALAMGIAENVLKEDFPVSVFALEMSASSLLDRMICSRSRVSSVNFRLGRLGREERHSLQHALNWVMSKPLKLYDESNMTADQVARAVRKDVERDGLKLAIVDYLQLFGRDNKNRSENRNNEIAAISRSMKMLAKECKIPILLLSQVSRPPKNMGIRPPDINDLRDSGAIAEDSDGVMFIYREWLGRRDRDDLKGKAELIIAKQRAGPVASIDIAFASHCVRFENLAERAEESGGQQGFEMA